MIIQLTICFLTFCAWLYSYLEKQNQLTHLRIQIPEIAKQLKMIREENTRLQYEIDQFENPEHLIELSRRPEFAHLKQPLQKEILTCPEGYAMQTSPEAKKELPSARPKPTLASGSK